MPRTPFTVELELCIIGAPEDTPRGFFPRQPPRSQIKLTFAGQFYPVQTLYQRISPWRQYTAATVDAIILCLTVQNICIKPKPALGLSPVQACAYAWEVL